MSIFFSIVILLFLIAIIGSALYLLITFIILKVKDKKKPEEKVEIEDKEKAQVKEKVEDQEKAKEKKPTKQKKSKKE